MQAFIIGAAQVLPLGRLVPVCLMRWLVPSLILSFLVCANGSGAPPVLHSPDLRLDALAANSMGPSQLFKSYRVDGPVLWSRDWPWKFDLSGVAWDRNNTATLITPRHVVMAAHYIRGVGQPVVFHDRSGKPHARKIQQVVKLRDHGVQCDVAVGLLDKPLPGSIRCYPLPAVREDGGAALIGATALVTEQKRALYFHRITNVHDNWLGMRFDETLPETRRKSLVKGDSGNPAFILSRGELVLIETHTIGGAGAGPYYGSSAIQEKLREVIRELDPEFTFRTIDLDPPTLADAETGRRSIPPLPRPVPQPTAGSDTRGNPATKSPATTEAPRQPRRRVILPPRS